MGVSSEPRAQRLKRVFGIEIEACARYGARLKIVASIEDPGGDCAHPLRIRTGHRAWCNRSISTRLLALGIGTHAISQQAVGGTAADDDVVEGVLMQGVSMPLALLPGSNVFRGPEPVPYPPICGWVSYPPQHYQFNQHGFVPWRSISVASACPSSNSLSSPQLRRSSSAMPSPR